MKAVISVILTVLMLAFSLAGCGEQENRQKKVTNAMLTVGEKEFSVVLAENETAQAIAGHFPMTLQMSEMNGNEKYYRFSERFPTSETEVGRIRAGDLMLYGSDCLVLFYDSFPTSYRYTPVGHIEDPDGLKEAVGKGTAEVSFALR